MKSEPKNPQVPFFATKVKEQTIVVKTGVRAGLAESRSKAMEEENK